MGLAAGALAIVEGQHDHEWYVDAPDWPLSTPTRYTYLESQLGRPCDTALYWIGLSIGRSGRRL